MIRWLRVLVIALLLPAYSVAAIGTAPVAEREVLSQLDLGDDPAALFAELGDTTDDASEHCLVHPLTVAAAQPPVAPSSLGKPRAVDAPRAPPIRPPRRAAHA